MLAIWSFHTIKHNKFFLYYAEGKDNHGVVEDHDAEVDTLCYKEIFKRSWTYLVAGYVNYATTLMIFPALTSTGKLSGQLLMADYKSQITLSIVGYHFSSRLKATLNLCLIYFKTT